jgi:hypothetical protein
MNGDAQIVVCLLLSFDSFPNCCVDTVEIMVYIGYSKFVVEAIKSFIVAKRRQALRARLIA